MDAIRRVLKVLLAHRWFTGASAAAIAAALVVAFATWGAGAEGNDATPSDEAASPSPTASHRVTTPRPKPSAHLNSTPTPSPSASTSASAPASPKPSPRPGPSPSAPKSYDPDADHRFTDVNGVWCPTTPPGYGDNGVCIVIDLPEVRWVGDDDPTHVSYIYPPGDEPGDDPRLFTDADYAFPQALGECWEAAIDSYPAWGGAPFAFCPAGAQSGEDWIDDPLHHDFSVGETPIQDYTGQDRIHTGQSIEPFPYIRADA